MDRREFLQRIAFLTVGASCFGLAGCRGSVGRIKGPNEKDRVGSHNAGAEVFKPIVYTVVDKMIARAEATPIAPNPADPNMFGMLDSSFAQPPVRRITFISIENKSAEELGDFKEHIKEMISQRIGESPAFEMISDAAVVAALRQTKLRPDDLLIPRNFEHFRNEMGANASFDYMLFAKLTSGTTVDNADMQRDYMLTLNLVNIHTFTEIKESEPISKEYLRSTRGKVGGFFKSFK